MAKCSPRRSLCGMSQGIYNPFFQNGAQWYGMNSGEEGVPGNAMLWDDGSAMLWDDGSYMTWD